MSTRVGEALRDWDYLLFGGEGPGDRGDPGDDLAQRIKWLLDGWPSDEAQSAMAEAQAVAAESRTNLSPRSPA
jgi:hypothetical protein